MQLNIFGGLQLHRDPGVRGSRLRSNQSIANNLISMQCSNFLKSNLVHFCVPPRPSESRENKSTIVDIGHWSSYILVMAFMTESPDTIVTTCGITSIKHSPGDARMPISAAKLTDNNMQVT